MQHRLLVCLSFVLFCVNGARAQVPCSQPYSNPDTCTIVTPNDALVALTARPQIALQPFAFALGSEIANFPILSSSGGFSWHIDNSGAPSERRRSFGSLFAERPATNGRGRFNVAMTFQHLDFTSASGIALSDVDTHNSYIPANTSVNVTSDGTVIAASYGLFDKVDVEMIFPMVRSAVSGDFTVTFGATGGFPAHLYQQSIQKSASGVGDVALRLKAWLLSSDAIDLAAGVEARLPTGNQEELLGAGSTQTRVSIIAAANLGDVSRT